jgi:hypothetical protein
MGTCGTTAQRSPAPAAPQRDVSAQRALGSGRTGRHRLVWQHWPVWDISLNQSWLSTTAASGARRDGGGGPWGSAKAEDDPTATVARGGGAVGRRSPERKRRGGAEAEQERRREG